MRKLLVVGFAWLSLLAVAQSQSNAKQDPPKATHEVKSPRDAASGQASGRAASSDGNGVIHRDIAARDAATGQATGKKMAADDWNEQKDSSTPQVKNVSVTETNADASKTSGYNVKSQNGARVAPADGSGVTVSSSSDSQSPRDASSGMASGKRQHKPVPADKKSDQTPNK